MYLANKLRMVPAVALTVLFIGTLAPAAFGGTAQQNEARRLQISNQLIDFKRTAAEMRHEAHTLKSFTPYKNLHWQSHTNRLDVLKNQVNELGKTLAELEAMMPIASENQSLAIEHARPHLVSVAENLTKAIELVREDRSSVRWMEYADAVSSISVHADELHDKVDAILDYEDARMRLDNLELQPSSTQGS